MASNDSVEELSLVVIVALALLILRIEYLVALTILGLVYLVYKGLKVFMRELSKTR